MRLEIRGELATTVRKLKRFNRFIPDEPVNEHLYDPGVLEVELYTEVDLEVREVVNIIMHDDYNLKHIACCYVQEIDGKRIVFRPYGFIETVPKGTRV